MHKILGSKSFTRWLVGAWAAWGAQESVKPWEQCFSVPDTSVCKKVKQIWFYQWRFLCLHHLLVYYLLKLHLQSDKISFIGPHHFPKNLEQKGKSNR